ncbi:MAG: sigma-70 family RNA polymerase sigma factor [bacterium]|nr:sigma-70 family RNA polymerase sigma factor [bacterium]
MLDDRTIISRCRAGQLELSGILVDRYKKPLYSFCCKLTGNRGEADDLFQDTWVKAVGNIHRCDEDKRFITWLFTICINLYRDRYRKYYRWLKVVKSYLSAEQMETEMTNIESKETGPDESAVKREQKENVRNVLGTLKDIYRIPLLLYYYREFSLDEIAGMLEIPKGTVKSRLAAGRNQLKKIMEDNGK